MLKPIRKDDKTTQIGLDIGDYSIKAVAIAHGSARPVLTGFAVKSVGNNIVNAIKDAHAELGLTKTSVNVSISGPAVVVRYVEMPVMTEEELKSAIRFEAEKVIPYNIDEVELDAAKLEDINPTRMRVVIVAAKKDLIQSQLKILSEAGLTPIIFDIDSFALMNAFTNAVNDPGAVCALINIGSKRSNLNIVKGNASYLSRDIDIAGYEITKILSERLAISLQDAEKIKDDKMSKFSELSDEDKKQIEGPLTDALMLLADELRFSFDFYENHYSGSVNKVYISGGVTTHDIVTSSLKEIVGRETQRWDPFANIDIADNLDKKILEKIKYQLAVATGLALRRVV